MYKAHDFNGDSHSDILWQNDSGEIYIWELNGPNMIGGGSVGGGSLVHPGPHWHVIGTGDFNGDGNSDVLWQNDSGEIVIWELNGTRVIAAASLGNPGPSWHAIGAGNFNVDSYSDIILQNSSGEVSIWELKGTTVIGGGSVRNPGPTWHVVATGDFRGPPPGSQYVVDDRRDILFQNDSGEVYIWEMNGTTVVGAGSVGNPGPTWHVKGTGDFDHDLHSGILLQNSNGQVIIWEMTGINIAASIDYGNAGPSWHALDAADTNNDGSSGVLWQNSSGEVYIQETNATGAVGNPGPNWHVKSDYSPYSTQRAVLPWQTDGSAVVFLQNDSGEAFLWTTNGAGITGAGSLGNPGPDWHVKGTGDFNGDGHPDLLWQNDTGEGFNLGIERDYRDRRRQHRQSGPELAHHFGRRFQPRWPIGHPVAEQQRRGGYLGNERHHCDRRGQSR